MIHPSIRGPHRRSALSGLMMGLLLLAGAAQARGVVLDPAQLPAAERDRLIAQIASARREDPEAFTLVPQLRHRLPALDAKKRGPRVPVSALLKPLGPRALFPMLEALAVEAPPQGELTPSAWLAMRVGLIEAVGVLRDGRAAPVLAAILDAPAQESDILRAAAEALGRLGDDAAASRLAALARGDDARRGPVLAGMGGCRRLLCAQALAAALQPHPEPALAKAVVRSLGEIGAAWAWRTPGVKARSEEQAVRAVAARALVSAVVGYDGEVRQAASNALLVVSAPMTGQLIEEARREANADQKAALDALSARLRRDPLRASRAPVP